MPFDEWDQIKLAIVTYCFIWDRNDIDGELTH